MHADCYQNCLPIEKKLFQRKGLTHETMNLLSYMNSYFLFIIILSYLIPLGFT